MDDLLIYSERWEEEEVSGLGDSIDGAVIKLREKVSQEDSDRVSSIVSKFRSAFETFEWRCVSLQLQKERYT